MYVFIVEVKGHSSVAIVTSCIGITRAVGHPSVSVVYFMAAPVTVNQHRFRIPGNQTVLCHILHITGINIRLGN